MTSRTMIADKRRDLIERIQTEGAEAAYEAALAVCLDPKAPAPARATCATTILRAGGYLNIKAEDQVPKELHEMTADELAASLREIRGRREHADEQDGSEKTEPSVFD